VKSTIAAGKNKRAPVESPCFISAEAAKERRKICSPRREPWAKVMIETLAAERRYLENNDRMFRPSGAVFLLPLIPWLTPWATDLPPLRG
jgi:hypothetical protein